MIGTKLKADDVQLNKDTLSLNDSQLREETPDVSKIYCFGDSKHFFKFSIGPMLWNKLSFDEKASSYEGNLRYFSVTFVPDRKIFMTGGVYTTTSQPSSTAFMIDLQVNTDKPLKKKNMLLKRFGHQSCYVNGIVYALGGFNH